jgi:hypothetical protein
VNSQHSFGKTGIETSVGIIDNQLEIYRRHTWSIILITYYQDDMTMGATVANTDQHWNPPLIDLVIISIAVFYRGISV